MSPKLHDGTTLMGRAPVIDALVKSSVGIGIRSSVFHLLLNTCVKSYDKKIIHLMTYISSPKGNEKKKKQRKERKRKGQKSMLQPGFGTCVFWFAFVLPFGFCMSFLFDAILFLFIKKKEKRKEKDAVFRYKKLTNTFK